MTAEIKAKRNPSRCPTSPGDLLREEVFPATRLSKAEFARQLGVSRQTVYDILDGKQPVTPAMAVRLGKFFGNGGYLWLAMQSSYDLWQAERSVDVSKIKTIKAA